MSTVDEVRYVVRDIAEHPVLELDYVDHTADNGGNMIAERQHGTFIFRMDFEGSRSVVHVVTVFDGGHSTYESSFPVEFIPQVVEHLQAIYKEMQQ